MFVCGFKKLFFYSLPVLAMIEVYKLHTGERVKDRQPNQSRHKHWDEIRATEMLKRERENGRGFVEGGLF